MKNTNGTGDHPEDDPKIARFPTPQERAEIERLKAANDLASKPKSEPILNVPPVTKWLCAVLIVVHCLLQLLLNFRPDISEAILEICAFVPERYMGGQPLSLGTFVGPVGHMFIHGGWLHLGVNVGTLMAFGAGLEKTIGSKKLLILFFLTGIIGAFTHLAYCLVYPAQAAAPLIGASGGISGLFGGVLMMAQQRGLMGEGGYRKLLPFVLIWILISVFFGKFGMPGSSNPIAWTTHIGGFIAGLLLYKPVLKLKI